MPNAKKAFLRTTGGSAKMRSESRKLAAITDKLSSQTFEAFSRVGTPLYMSPEVLQGKGYDWKSDVWSMGCIAYELCALRSPFRSSDKENLNLYELF